MTAEGQPRSRGELEFIPTRGVLNREPSRGERQHLSQRQARLLAVARGELISALVGVKRPAALPPHADQGGGNAVGDVSEVGRERQRRGIAHERAAESTVCIRDRSRDLGVGADALIDTVLVPLARQRDP